MSERKDRRETRRVKISIASDPILQDNKEFNIQQVTCDSLREERPQVYEQIVLELCLKTPRAQIAKNNKVALATIKSVELTETRVIESKLKFIKGKLITATEKGLDNYLEALEEGNVKVETIPLSLCQLLDKYRLLNEQSTSIVETKEGGDKKLGDFLDTWTGRGIIDIGGQDITVIEEDNA